MIPLKLRLISLIYYLTFCHFCIKQKLMSIEVVLFFASSLSSQCVCVSKSTRQCGAILYSEQSWGHGTWPHAACVLKSVHSCQTLNLLLTHAALFSTATSLVRTPAKFRLRSESKICVFVDGMIPINICPAFFVCLFVLQIIETSRTKENLRQIPALEWSAWIYSLILSAPLTAYSSPKCSFLNEQSGLKK